VPAEVYVGPTVLENSRRFAGDTPDQQVVTMTA
jgi:hypothetical protein